jgi:hypothetical protein
MFKLAQSIPDFDSAKFAAALADFSRAVAQADPTVMLNATPASIPSRP